MAEIQNAIYARIHKPQDFSVSNDSPLYNEVVIHAGQGDLVLAVPRDCTIEMAIDLIKAEAGRRNINQVVTVFEKVS